MGKVIGIGESILDIIFRDGKVQKAVAGGSAFNCLVSLSRSGIPVQFISELATDKVGDLIYSFMQENNIDTQYLNRPARKTAVSLAFLDDERQASYSFYKEPSAAHMGFATPSIDDTDYFLFGSYFSLNPVWRKQMRELLDSTKQQGATLYYDPNFRSAHAKEAITLHQSFIENFELADIVRGSDEDFYNIFHTKDIDAIYDNHIKYYCKYLLVTQGKEGVKLYTPTIRKHYSANIIEPISTIGAGDAFNAGMLYGLHKHGIVAKQLHSVSESIWDDLVSIAQDFSCKVCLTEENYL